MSFHPMLIIRGIDLAEDFLVFIQTAFKVDKSIYKIYLMFAVSFGKLMMEVKPWPNWGTAHSAPSLAETRIRCNAEIY